MNRGKRIILAGAFVFILFYLIASGCAWVTLTAKDRLDDKIEIKAAKIVQAIYLEFAKPTGKNQRYFNEFKTHLEDILKKYGYQLVSSKENADLVLKIKTHFYTKRTGDIIFFLFILPMDFTYSFDGLKAQVLYITNQGKWSKVYRAYKRDESEYGKLVAAIIDDLYIGVKGNSRP